MPDKTQKTIPHWLRQHLINTGALTADGVSRAARARHCPHCGALTLRGLDEENCAFDVSVDIDPVTQIGEVLAIASGLNTYYLLREANSSGSRIWTINRREITHLQAGRTGIVMAQHRCGNLLPREEQETKKPVTDHTDGRPPF